MKKLCIPLMTLFLSIMSANAESFTVGGETYNYTVTATSTPNEGVKHTRMRFTAPSSCNVSIVEVDLTNPNIRAEAFMGGDKIQTLEKLTTFSSRKTAAGRNPIVVQNGHFWSMSSQTGTSAGVHATKTLLGGCMINGKIITETNYANDQWNGGPSRHGILGFTSDGKAHIGNYQTMLKAMCPAKWGTDESVNSLLITEVNKYCIASDYMALFTPEYPSTQAFKVLNTSSGQPGLVVTGTSTEVYLTLDAGQTMKHNGWITATVGKILKNTSGGTRGNYDLVLVASPGVSQNVLASVAVGDQMKFKYYWHPVGDTGTIPDFENVIAGNAIVMKNGAVTTRATDESYNTTSYARSLYGINSGGTKLYMCVVDKGSNEAEGISYGATCTRISYIMNHFGAQTVLQVDGGGSAEMAINGSIVTKPSDSAGERSVASGVVIYAENSTTPTPSAQNTASPLAVTLNAVKGGESESAQVSIKATGLTTEMNVNPNSSAFVVTKSSDWNGLTGGILTISLNTAKDAGAYSGYVAVQSGTNRVEINCTGTITESSTPTPTPDLSEGESAESGYTFKQEWQQVEGHLAANTQSRWATAFDGKIYVNDHSTSKLYYWNSLGLTDTGITSAAGTAITSDDAHNIVVSTSMYSGGNTAMKILPSGGTTFQDLTITLPSEVAAAQMQYLGKAVGDIMGDGGALYLFPSGATSVAKIIFKNGVQSSASAIPVNVITPDGQTIAIPLTSDVNSNNVAVRRRNNKHFYHLSGTEFVAYPDNGISTTQGGTIFTLAKTLYAVEPIGTSYCDGFQIVDYNKNQVVATHQPQLSAAIVSPNANCIIAEPVGTHSARIYQYVPGQLATMYTFEVDETVKVSEIDEESVVVKSSMGTISIEGSYATSAIYNMSGVLVASDKSQVSCLPGIYIVVVDGIARKIIVR